MTELDINVITSRYLDFLSLNPPCSPSKHLPKAKHTDYRPRTCVSSSESTAASAVSRPTGITRTAIGECVSAAPIFKGRIMSISSPVYPATPAARANRVGSSSSNDGDRLPLRPRIWTSPPSYDDRTGKGRWDYDLRAMRRRAKFAASTQVFAGKS